MFLLDGPPHGNSRGFLVYPAGNYMFNINNRNTRTRCEICSKLTIKIPERHQWRRSGIFIVNTEHISHLVSIANFEHVIAGWETTKSQSRFKTLFLDFTRNQQYINITYISGNERI